MYQPQNYTYHHELGNLDPQGKYWSVFLHVCILVLNIWICVFHLGYP